MPAKPFYESSPTQWRKEKLDEMLMLTGGLYGKLTECGHLDQAANRRTWCSKWNK
jgi:hypothetical protein